MHQYAIAARSKLKNFAPRISLCAERGALSVRNANIVWQHVRIRQGFNKNLTPQSACDFRAFGNSFNLLHTSVIVVLPLSLAAEAGDLRYCVTLCFSLFFRLWVRAVHK